MLVLGSVFLLVASFILSSFSPSSICIQIPLQKIKHVRLFFYEFSWSIFLLEKAPRKWKGLLRGTPIQIPNHSAWNHQLTITWNTNINLLFFVSRRSSSIRIPSMRPEHVFASCLMRWIVSGDLDRSPYEQWTVDVGYWRYVGDYPPKV